jgi:GNAT superfamily N-acetyltransferase
MQTPLTVRALSAPEFNARVVPALSEREAENGLPFGIAQRLATQPEAAPDALLLGVESAGTIVAAAVWTPPHGVVVTRLPQGAAARIAGECARTGWAVTGALGPDGHGLELAEQLAGLSGAAVRLRLRQRVYQLTSVNPVPRTSGSMRRASAPADVDIVAGWYAEFAQEVELPHASNAREWASAAIASGSAFLWEDATAGCMACLSRETPNGRAIGPVYTPPAARRRGYATSLVAELSRHVLTSGKRFASLFTDDANSTSNHIYESIGFCFVCRYDAYSLVPPVE